MKILIADKFEDVGLEQLKQIADEVTREPELKEGALTDRLASLDPTVLIVRSTKVQPEQLAAAKSLKLIIRAGSGYDTIDTATAKEKGIKVANCPGMNAVAVAELAMGHVVNLDRRISDNVADVRAHKWNKKGYSKARGLKNSTLGIVGLGRIGRELAQRALAFEMKVLWYDVVENLPPIEHPNAKRTDMDTLFRESDYVSLHVPGSGETKHLINAERLATMKPHACVVNTSRASVIDEPALIDALTKGTIRAAAVDVYDNEPAADAKEIASPLCDVPGVYGTHHIGASTEQAQLAVAEETVRIVKTLKETGEVVNCVNA
jgi:D-3-phosphoglycerate dehydrogenase